MTRRLPSRRMHGAIVPPDITLYMNEEIRKVNTTRFVKLYDYWAQFFSWFQTPNALPEISGRACQRVRLPRRELCRGGPSWDWVGGRGKESFGRPVLEIGTSSCRVDDPAVVRGKSGSLTDCRIVLVPWIRLQSSDQRYAPLETGEIESSGGDADDDATSYS